MSASDTLSDKDKYITTIRNTGQGRADLIVTDITTGESQAWPLRWRQLIMLSYEAIKALDSWPLTEAKQKSHHLSFSDGPEDPPLKSEAAQP